MSHDVALFLLNSTTQLVSRADELHEAQHVICDPSMDIAPIRNATDAKLYAYFRADAVGLQGEQNPWWNAFRATMAPHLYKPTLREPEVGSTALLIKPTMNAAEALAAKMSVTWETGWDGCYLDQSWATKPHNFVQAELPYWITDRGDALARRQIDLRWRAYLDCLLGYLYDDECPMILNCGGNPHPGHIGIVAIEVNAGRTVNQAIEKAASFSQSLIWFGGVGLGSRVIEGRLL